MKGTGAAFSEGFIWGALIGAFLRWLGTTRIVIILLLSLMVAHCDDAAQAEAKAASERYGVRVYIDGFNTADRYNPTLFARVVNPSDKPISRIEASCENISFDADKQVPAGYQVGIETRFVNAVSFGYRIDPYAYSGGGDCLITKMVFDE